MKTCKKLFSLLLVAVMLVAAIPFAAMAAPINETVPNPKVVAKCNGVVIAEATYNGDFVPAFDPTVQEHVETAIGGSYVSVPAGYKLKLPATYDVANKTLTVNYEIDTTVHTQHDFEIIGSGDANGHIVKCKLKGCGSQRAVPHGASTGVPGAPGEGSQTIYATAPTCTTSGNEPGIRYDCGYVTGGKELPALGHDFQNGKCTRCNAPDPSATTPGTGSGSGTTTPGGSTGGSGSTGGTTGGTTTTPASYSKVVVVYCDENGNVKTNAGKTVILTTAYTGSTANNDAQGILNHAGIGESVNNYASATVAVSGDTITVTLTDKADTRYVLNLTVVTGTTTTTKTYRAAYTGSVDTMSVLKGFGVDKDFNLDNYTYSNFSYDNNKTFTLTMTAKPTAADKYTVNCVVNGTQFASKTDVTYVGSFESNITNAQAILNAAGIQKTASEYKKVTITKSNTNVITVDLRNTVVVRVYNNANSYSEVTMDVGQPYVNYLGANLINNSTFGGITVKDTSDRNTYYSASQVNGRTALVSAFDKEITIQRNGDSCTLYFLRSDGTVLESRKLYAGDQIGTLPSYIVGNVPATWTYNGKPISATDVYNFKTTSVNIVPYFGGISDVYVDVYTNGNVKTLQTRVKVTDLVQNGVLYLNSEVKSAISSALRNSSNKNLTYTAFFDASSWSDFIKTKNTNGAAEPIRVGDNSERQGAVYLYVMVNNVTQKATDSTNPKTGDDVKLGVAAAVLAVAVVGFGAAIVIKKKKGVQ